MFDQLGEIDRLLQMMMGLDAKRDNLADNDELSELYQKSLMLRPKIVRLIEKYTQKKGPSSPVSFQTQRVAHPEVKRNCSRSTTSS